MELAATGTSFPLRAGPSWRTRRRWSSLSEVELTAAGTFSASSPTEALAVAGGTGQAASGGSAAGSTAHGVLGLQQHIMFHRRMESKFCLFLLCTTPAPVEESVGLQNSSESGNMLCVSTTTRENSMEVAGPQLSSMAWHTELCISSIIFLPSKITAGR